MQHRKFSHTGVVDIPGGGHSSGLQVPEGDVTDTVTNSIMLEDGPDEFPGLGLNTPALLPHAAAGVEAERLAQVALLHPPQAVEVVGFESLYLVGELVYENPYSREVRDITDLGWEKAGDGPPW